MEGTWHAAGRRPRTVTGLLGAAGRQGGALLSVLCGALITAYAVSVVKRLARGVPGWLSGLKPLPSAQVMIPVSWDRAPHRALCSAGSLLPPLSLSASTCDLCQINK